MNEQVRDKKIESLAARALTIQTLHFERTRGAALKLAARQHATETE